MVRHAVFAFAFAAGSAACTFSSLDEFSIDNVETADAELDTSSRLMWSRFDEANEEAVTELVGRLHLIVEHARAHSDMPLQRRIGRLTATDLPSALRDKVDPGKAVGMLVATDIPCSLAQVERLTIARNQPELYPDVYVTYDRTYSSSDADYLARKTDRLTWTTLLTADLQGEYSSKLDGTIRYVDRAAPDGEAVILVHSFFPEPAVCKKSENRWDQDYQIERYYVRAPGRVVYDYARWRDLKQGSLTLKTQIATSVKLAGMIDWDVRTGKLCKDGRGR
jgi:hypothetical protein